MNLSVFDWPIRCAECGKDGTLGHVQHSGWRLAPNMIAGYVCSPACDREMCKKQEEERKARKGKKR